MFQLRKNTVRARRTIAQELIVPDSFIPSTTDEMEYVARARNSGLRIGLEFGWLNVTWICELVR